MSKRVYTSEQRKAAVERVKKWRETHDRKSEYGSKSLDRYKKWVKENQRDWYIVNKRHRLKKKYGLTLEQYDVLLQSQNGKCAICTNDFSEAIDRRSHVDHDHVSGRVRGLLCGKCNRGLGMFSDSAKLLERALAYLRK